MAQIPEPPVPQADPQQTPLTRYPLQDINTPCQTDGFYVELVSRTDPAYQAVVPIKRGTPYSEIQGADSRIVAQYADNPLYFLKQTADVDSMRVLFNSAYDNYVLWIWATQTLSQDTYNATVTYMEDASGFPQYVRTSEIRRKVYEAAPEATYQGTLTGLLSVKITAAGSGYTQATATSGSSVAVAVILGGTIVDWVVTVEGSGITDDAVMVITGDGTGAVARTRVQPATAVLVHQEKRELPEGDPKSHDYVQVVYTYRTEPGPVLTAHQRSEAVRGRTVDVTTQEGLTGTVAVETGNLIISSVVKPLSAQLDQRETQKVASLPPDETYAMWAYVPIPTLLFDVDVGVYCNMTDTPTVVVTPALSGGASFLRKHRVTVSYSNTYPNPDLSGSSYAVEQIQFNGKLVRFDFNNVLNDNISGSFTFSIGGCTWDEVYSFGASTPSATDFAAGAWYVREFRVEFWGESMYRSTKTEFYSAAGNPSI